MFAKPDSAIKQNITYEDSKLKLKNSKFDTNTNFITSCHRENLLLSECESKLSAFSDRLKNTNIDYNTSYIKTYKNENFHQSLKNSENGNMKIIKSQLPNDLNNVENKNFNLENFFDEVYYEKELESQFIIYIKDKIVNRIDYSKIFILNNNNFFVLQIPFDNKKSQIFRVDYGRTCIMNNYTIELTEDILKIIIGVENNCEFQKIAKIQKLNKIIMFKLFFRYFKNISSNRIIYKSAIYYNNNKLKKKILNLLKFFYLIKIKENVYNIKIRRFIMKKNNFIWKIKLYKEEKSAKAIHSQFKLVKIFFNVFRFKAKRITKCKSTMNFNFNNSAYQVKQYHEKIMKENIVLSLKNEKNRRILFKNNIKMAAVLFDLFTKRKLYNIIKSNYVNIKGKEELAFKVYKFKRKLIFFKKLFENKHSMKKFYYVSNKYNYFNHLFLFFIIQKYINFSQNKKKENIKISDSENPSEIYLKNIKDKSYRSFSTINNKEDSFICDVNYNNSNSNLIIDLNKSGLEFSINKYSNKNNYNVFDKNCNFKITTNFKNYIFSNFYNNNFHYPLIKNIFNILKKNWKYSKNTRIKLSETIVSRKIKLNKELNFLKIKMTRLREKEYRKTYRRVFWNKFKMRLNQKKLQKILKEKTEADIFKLTFYKNYFIFINEIDKRIKFRKYMESQKKYLLNKLKKFKFYQFLSSLYMKRKIQKQLYDDNINHNYYQNKKRIIHLNNENHVNIKTQNLSKKSDQQFISRLISSKNYLNELKERFSNFKRLLNLRLNYYKLIINCKRDMIIKRKTNRFREICLKINNKFYHKIKNLKLITRQNRFERKKQIKSFYNKIINLIRNKKRNIFIRSNLINNSKKISFVALKEYNFYKKRKSQNDIYFGKILKSLQYKYYYETYFLKSAEILKMKKYLKLKLKKIQIKNIIKSFKKIAINKKVNNLFKNYMKLKYLNKSLCLARNKSNDKNLQRIFKTKIRKYFFRCFLRCLKKLKIVQNIKNRKKHLLNIFRENNTKHLINNIIITKSHRNLEQKSKENFLIKLFFIKLKKINYTLKKIKLIYIKFLRRVFMRKIKLKLLNKNKKIYQFDVINKKIRRKIMQKYIITKIIIAKTLKMFNVCNKCLDLNRKKYFSYFFFKFKKNYKENLIKQRIKKIKIREFLKIIKFKTQKKANEKKKSSKIRLKNCLKYFINKILESMVLTQNLNILKEKISYIIIDKNFFILKKNIKIKKKLKQNNQTITNKDSLRQQTSYKKFLTLIKAKIKINKIKQISLKQFKNLLKEVFVKLNINKYKYQKRKLSIKLQYNNICKNFLVLKNTLKNNSKKRLLKLKEETYKNKFEYSKNIKKFLIKIRRIISLRCICKVNLNNKSNNFFLKLDRSFNNSLNNTEFEKYSHLKNKYNILFFKSFLNRIKQLIEFRKISLVLRNKYMNRFTIGLFKKKSNMMYNKNQKLKALQLLYINYLFKKLFKLFKNIKNEKLMISSFNLNTESNLSISKLNKSILNYSNSFKLKISNFLKKIKKSVLVKKSYEKFYQHQIISESKNFVKRLKSVISNHQFKAYFKNYFEIQNKLINYKFFLDRLLKSLISKKENKLKLKSKFFNLLKKNTEYEKMLKSYLEEANSI